MSCATCKKIRGMVVNPANAKRELVKRLRRISRNRGQEK